MKKLTVSWIATMAILLHGLAWADKVKDVTVVNDFSEPIPVSGETTVSGSVTLEGTSDVNVINGPLDVNVANAPAARVPFVSDTGFVIGGQPGGIEATVAGANPGLLLVIEQVGIKLELSDPTVKTTEWALSGLYGTESWTFPLVFPQEGAPGFLQASQRVRLYHDMSEPLKFRYFRDPIGPQVQLTVTVSGYTIPIGDPRLGP